MRCNAEVACRAWRTQSALQGRHGNNNNNRVNSHYSPHCILLHKKKRDGHDTLAEHEGAPCHVLARGIAKRRGAQIDT